MAVWRKTEGLCYYCGSQLPDCFETDHVVPKSKGGTDEITNLVPCCKSCNSSKGTKTVEEYRHRRASGALFTAKQIDCLVKFDLWLELQSRIKARAETIKFWFENKGAK